MNQPSEVPVVLCIDVEPDPRTYDRANAPGWAGFERLIEGIPALRERLSEAAGRPAAFTWFLRMDPQVADTWDSPAWVAETYEDPLADLMANGDELGVHIHPWRLEPKTGAWVADYQDPVWAEHCLTMGLDAFKTAFGHSPASHRGGDHFLTGAMLEVLDAHGVQVDLTVEPGVPPLGAGGGETASGLRPDYRGVPTSPYRSSPSRFPIADPDGSVRPLLVPLLSAPDVRPPFRRSPLYLWAFPAAILRLRLAAELLRQRPPVLALAVRSDMALRARTWDRITGNLEHLARRRGAAFVTASEAAAGRSMPSRRFAPG